jgi:hypothetical protein
MSANLLPISSQGGFITGGNIVVSSYPVSSPAPYISGFSSVSADGINLLAGNINGGIATVVTDGINSIALALGAQMDVFGFPFSAAGIRGQLTITDVTTPSEANGSWYYQSVSDIAYQLYTDSTYSTLVDATGWSAYTGGGNVAITKQTPAANIVINSNGYLSKFGETGNLTLPNNLSVAGGEIYLTGEGLIRSNNDTVTIQSYDTANSIGRGLRVGDNGGVYLERGTDPSWLSFHPDGVDATIYSGPGTSGGAGKNLSISAGVADLGSYNTSPGGNLNLVGGIGASDDGGGGGPGGSVNIRAGDSADPAGHAGNVVVQAGSANTWTFDYTGNLTSTGSMQIQNIRTVDGTVHVGQGAGLTSQGTYAIAMGRFAGSDTQGGAALAIGQLAGGTSQGNSAIALGLYAANNTQGANSIAIGTYAANLTQSQNSIAIGNQAGSNAQGQQAVAIGYNAGNITQKAGAVAIGLAAGSNTQGNNSVAFGTQAAEIQQGVDAISIGTLAGRALQANSAIAIGSSAAIGGQGEHSIAIGSGAGGNTQATLSIAMGLFAGEDHQGTKAVAIGAYAGNVGQGANSIAIGASAGVTNQASSSIILNATGTTLNGTNSGLYVAPVRNDTGNVTNTVFYNTSTKELTYSASAQVTGSWTLAAGVNTVTISVPLNGTYSIWVNGNIPNGIITYTATAVVTNNNVPVLGSQYGWYYSAGGNLVLTSMPAQIVGTVGTISTATVSTTTANVFSFGITNNSGASQVVNWGYTKL